LGLRYADIITPMQIALPVREIPHAKELKSPTHPLRVGTAPPPTRKAIGTMRETAMFLSPAELVMDNTASPAGKKQTAATGCINIAATTHVDADKPMHIVMNPENRNTTLRTFFGP